MPTPPTIPQKKINARFLFSLIGSTNKKQSDVMKPIINKKDSFFVH